MSSLVLDGHDLSDVIAIDTGAETGPAPIGYDSDFARVHGVLYALVSSGEFSQRALAVTDAVIALNAASYTAWYERSSLLGCMAHTSRRVKYRHTRIQFDLAQSHCCVPPGNTVVIVLLHCQVTVKQWQRYGLENLTSPPR